MSVTWLTSIAVVNEVDPLSRCLPLSTTQEVSRHSARWIRVQKRVGVQYHCTTLLVFGCAYERISDKSCSATTLRRRRDEWIEAGVMEELEAMALESYDRIIGLKR